MSVNNFDFEDDRKSFSFYVSGEEPEFRDKLLSFIEKEVEDARALYFSENGMSLNGRDDRFKALGKNEILIKLIKWVKDN